jgi:L-amino acid N-acyltransferase YncA
MDGTLRLATPEDAAALAAIYRPYVQDTAISFEEVAPTPEVFAERIQRTLETYPYLVYEAEGRPIGYAYAGRHAERAAYRWSVDVAVYVEDGSRRRGVGRILYERLFAILARQGFHAAYAGVTQPNERSMGLHAATGFELIGMFPEVGYKHGAWRDVAWLRRTLGPGSAPAEPIPFPRLED